MLLKRCKTAGTSLTNSYFVVDVKRDTSIYNKESYECGLILSVDHFLKLNFSTGGRFRSVYMNPLKDVDVRY